jgi:hypothetical protein
MKNLVNIQNELKVPKGNFNSFGKYRYRSAEDILEALKPILLRHNAVLVISDEVVAVGEKIFIKATASLTLTDDLANFVKTVFSDGFAEISEHKGMSAEQTTGTASSYARKYALNGLFLIDETEADADSQPKQQTKPITVAGVVTIDRIRKAETAIRELGGQVEAFNPTGKSEDDLKAELEALTDLYNRLKRGS